MPADPYFPVIRQLTEYETWCNARAFESASLLPTSDLHRPFPFGFNTIHKTLFHIVDVFRGWSGRISPTIHPPQWLTYDPNTPLAELASLNTSLSQTFLASIDASHAAGLLHEDRRIHQLFHLITHGTHHRTQYITMLRLLGIDPPFEAGDFGGWSNPRNR